MSVESRPAPMDYYVPPELRPHFGHLTDYLSQFVNPEKCVRFNDLAQKRSRRVLTIFEDTYHSHNVSAVLRSMEAFGFQDIFFLFSPYTPHYRVKDNVERGSATWLSVRRAESLVTTGRILKESGYKIALVSLPGFSKTADYYSEELPSFSVSQFESQLKPFLGDENIALVFGNEREGVSAGWLEVADLYVSVEMSGFVESLNVSVCAGIILQSLRQMLHQGNNDMSHSGLDAWERDLLVESWIARSTTSAGDIVRLRNPDLLAYYDFVKSGQFLSPFSKA